MISVNYFVEEYDSSVYGKRPVNGHLELYEMELNIADPKNAELKLEKHELESSEAFFDPGWFSSDRYEFYTVEKSIKPFQLPGSFAALTVMAPSKVVNHSRVIYNFLDFLGDVGGLFVGLKLICLPLVSLFSHGSLSVFLITKIFYEVQNHAPFSANSIYSDRSQDRSSNR